MVLHVFPGGEGVSYSVLVWAAGFAHVGLVVERGVVVGAEVAAVARVGAGGHARILQSRLECFVEAQEKQRYLKQEVWILSCVLWRTCFPSAYEQGAQMSWYASARVMKALVLTSALQNGCGVERCL